MRCLSLDTSSPKISAKLDKFQQEGDSSENVPQLHRLPLNGMKLSGLIGLGPVSIDVGSKKN